MTTRTVVLVSCGAAKLDEPAAARDLYTSTLFRKARRYAEAVGDAWYILSARHGLVHPLLVLYPYEHKLAAAEAPAWGWMAAESVVVREVGRSDRVRVEILAGELYAKPIRERLRCYRSFDVVEPLAGLQVGERLRWFNQNTPTV